MARWKLMTKHYLKVEDEPWEYKETDLISGREVRKTLQVPRHLDPESEFTEVEGRNAILVVCHQDKSKVKSDIVFFGDPTPDMEPMDDEAEAISEKLKSKWIHPIDALPSNGNMEEMLIRVFGTMQMPAPVAAQSQSAISIEEFQALKESVALLAARNAELESASSSETLRRV